MKLVFFYLKSCYDITYDLSVNLSEDYLITLTPEGTIGVEDIKTSLDENFYGENITNVSALVGRNGTGKSTILNLLGLKRLDLVSCNHECQWLAIYENESIFFLEAFNIDKTINIPGSTSKFIAYKMERNKNELTFTMQIDQYHQINDEFFIIHQPDLSNSRKANGSLHENDDRNYGFKRNYLVTNTASFYSFISDKENKFCSNLHSKKIKLKIINGYSEEKNSDYQFYSLFKRYSELDLPIFNRKKTERIKDSQKIFIIELLEEYTISLVENIFEKDKIDDYNAILERNVFNSDILNYEEIKVFFLDLIKEISDKLVENDDESIAYTGSRNLENIIDFLEKDILTYQSNSSGLHISTHAEIDLTSYDNDVYYFINEVNKSNLTLKFELPKMSSGEYEINSRLAGIDKSIKLSINANNKVSGFIILLDEYDKHLHPEWARTFLNHTLNFLSNKYSSYKFQLIITTHSPYIISDLRRENVIKLTYNTNENKYESHKSQKSFASNIYDIINDSFYLSQPIGEFAISKINWAIDSLEKLDQKESIENINRIESTINSIDDDFIKKTLLSKLESKRFKRQTEIEKIDNEIKKLNQLKIKLQEQESSND